MTVHGSRLRRVIAAVAVGVRHARIRPCLVLGEVRYAIAIGIRRAIANHDFSSGGDWQRITVSCGAATIGVVQQESEAGLMFRREYTGNLLREAYYALESGRSAGTNRTSVGAYRP